MILEDDRLQSLPQSIPTFVSDWSQYETLSPTPHLTPTLALDYVRHHWPPSSSPRGTFRYIEGELVANETKQIKTEKDNELPDILSWDNGSQDPDNAGGAANVARRGKLFVDVEDWVEV